jgi:tight adherence protein B
MKVKALSAEGRLSGNILAAVPVGVTLAIRFIRPDFYVNATWGFGLLDVLGFAAALVAGGYLIIRRISNIRV